MNARVGTSLSATEGVGTIMRTLQARPQRIAAVLILLGVGAVWARAGQPARVALAGPLDKPGADGKDDKPGKEPAKSDDRASQKKYKFTVQGEKWDKVFEWLAKETGKSIITKYVVSGTFSV